MLPRTYEDQNCSVARALEVLGDRWTMLVIRDAFAGVRRFDDFQRGLGVARNVLSDKGVGLWRALIALMQWGDRHYAPPAGPPRVARHRECGGAVDEHFACARCGAQLAAPDVRLEPGPG